LQEPDKFWPANFGRHVLASRLNFARQNHQLGRPKMASIVNQLESYRSALAQAKAQGDDSTARKLEQNIRELEDFQARHPEEQEAPTPLEVFCDLNPADEMCRVYDD
jgi:hypothetical protein